MDKRNQRTAYGKWYFDMVKHAAEQIDLSAKTKKLKQKFYG